MDKAMLPTAYSISAFLNPMFGREANIIGSTLMTPTQYYITRQTVLRLMQNEYKKINPHNDLVDEVECDNSKDGIVEPMEDINHQRAKEELDQFERF